VSGYCIVSGTMAAASVGPAAAAVVVLSRRGHQYCRRYRWTDISPTSIVACLWFNALVVGWKTTDSELHAADAYCPTGA
jgi:hypothetical protein